MKALFHLSVCNECDKKDHCCSIQQKKYRAYYFTHDDYLRKRRLKQRASIPRERRKLRNNVESTMNIFACRMPKGKLKARGAFKAEVFACSVAISANLGRIYRYIADGCDTHHAPFSRFHWFLGYFKFLVLLFRMTRSSKFTWSSQNLKAQFVCI